MLTPSMIGAGASCTDAPFGTVSRVVIDPATMTVTHLVMAERRRRPGHRSGHGRWQRPGMDAVRRRPGQLLGAPPGPRSRRPPSGRPARGRTRRRPGPGGGRGRRRRMARPHRRRHRGTADPARAQAQDLRGDGQSLHFHATDPGLSGTGEWLVTRAPSGITVARGHGKADVAVRGPAASLLLVLPAGCRPPILASKSSASRHCSPNGSTTRPSDRSQIQANHAFTAADPCIRRARRVHTYASFLDRSRRDSREWQSVSRARRAAESGWLRQVRSSPEPGRRSGHRGTSPGSWQRVEEVLVGSLASQDGPGPLPARPP